MGNRGKRVERPVLLAAGCHEHGHRPGGRGVTRRERHQVEP